MYSLVIQEYGQNTEGHICPNSTLSKYGRIQRISENFQNTAEYRTKYSRIQWIGNCSELDRKLYPCLVSGHEGVIVGPAGEAASAAAETASASSRKALMIGDDMI